MLRNIALLFVLMNVSLQLFCQGDTTLFYRLTLKDKANNSHTIDKPADFLSEKAIARRERYNIPVCENDLPLTSTYIDSLTNAGYSIRTKSKWFNSVVVELNDSNLIALLDSFSFIKDKKLVYR